MGPKNEGGEGWKGCGAMTLPEGAMQLEASKEATYWKFLRAGLRSENGERVWKVGEWQRVTPPLEMCKRGFHCSPSILGALTYVSGEILAEVEGRGEHLKEGDKLCWEELRVLHAYHWTKVEKIQLYVYAAELALPLLEAHRPNDPRPRMAIAAARNWLDKEAPEAAIGAEPEAAWEAEVAWIVAAQIAAETVLSVALGYRGRTEVYLAGRVAHLSKVVEPT